jgi:hypothetical protein
MIRAELVKTSGLYETRIGNRIVTHRDPVRAVLDILAAIKDEALLRITIRQSALTAFISDQCCYAPGYLVPLSEFFERFRESLPESELSQWSRKSTVVENLPPMFAYGRYTENKRFVANIAFKQPKRERDYYFVVQPGGRLKKVRDK